MFSSSSLFIAVASIFSSSSGVAMRQTLLKNGSVGGYLAFYFFISCLISLFLNALIPFIHPISITMIVLGALTGILMIGLMQTMGKAFQTGSTGMTLAFLNSGSVFASLAMGLIFKNDFGYPLTALNMTGMALIIGGLFWGAKSDKKSKDLSFGLSSSESEEFTQQILEFSGEVNGQRPFTRQKSTRDACEVTESEVEKPKTQVKVSGKWLLFATLTFLIQGIILTIFQYKSLLIQSDLPHHQLIFTHLDPFEDKWFIPSLFLSAWIAQFLFFVTQEKRKLKKAEWFGGVIGGISNGLATFFLLLSVQFAGPKEKMMLFPIFTVLVIILGCIYSKYYLKEPVRWSAIALCGIGVLIGSY